MFAVIKEIYRRLSSGRASVSPPRVLGSDELDSYRWDLTTEVAVLGFGGAGAAAALEAMDQGARVTVLERFNGGGSTKISGGIFYAGGGTQIQRQAGVEDSPENMYNYLVQETGDAVCEKTLREFCETSPASLDWLMQHGVPFNASLCPFKTSYPSNDYYYYYSGNESFAPYTETASPAPRGHRAHGMGVSGAMLFNPLQESVRSGGAEVLTQHRALSLISDESGAVIGLEVSRLQAHGWPRYLHEKLYALLTWSRYMAMYAPALTWLMRAGLEWLETRYGETISVRATRGVIISTGGFFFNREMVGEYAPEFLPGMPLGTIGDDGSGILLGQGVGARTALMDNISEWRFINPPESFVRGILVDSSGERICNEMLYGAQLAEQIQRRAGGQAWLLIDDRLFRQALREIGPRRAMWFQTAAALMFLFMARRKGADLKRLGDKLGVPAGALDKTVRNYNEMCRAGCGDALGKPSDYLSPLEDGPWYALDCRSDGWVRNPCITLGGLAVDEDSGAVLAQDGSKIKGLYAAGRAAIGIASHSYVSGLSIAGCIFSGRRAGRHAGAGKD